MSDYICYSTALLNKLSHPPPFSLTYQALTPQVNDYWQTETIKQHILLYGRYIRTFQSSAFRSLVPSMISSGRPPTPVILREGREEV